MSLCLLPVISENFLRQWYERICGHAYPSEYELQRALESAIEMKDQEMARLQNKISDLEDADYDRRVAEERNYRLESEISMLQRRRREPLVRTCDRCGRTLEEHDYGWPWGRDIVCQECFEATAAVAWWEVAQA